MPRSNSGAKRIRLHEAIQEIAALQAENAHLRKLLAEANKVRTTAQSANRIIAGFGRDWSQGFSKPVLSASSQEAYRAEQHELLSA